MAIMTMSTISTAMAMARMVPALDRQHPALRKKPAGSSTATCAGNTRLVVAWAAAVGAAWAAAGEGAAAGAVGRPSSLLRFCPSARDYGLC